VSECGLVRHDILLSTCSAYDSYVCAVVRGALCDYAIAIFAKAINMLAKARRKKVKEDCSGVCEGGWVGVIRFDSVLLGSI
jgi:hypothetical protein